MYIRTLHVHTFTDAGKPTKIQPVKMYVLSMFICIKLISLCACIFHYMNACLCIKIVLVFSNAYVDVY